jgi:hypothetical protein
MRSYLGFVGHVPEIQDLRDTVFGLGQTNPDFQNAVARAAASSINWRRGTGWGSASSAQAI